MTKKVGVSYATSIYVFDIHVYLFHIKCPRVKHCDL